MESGKKGRIVITGATGAIGRALISESIRCGYEVLAVIHRSSKRADELLNMDHCRVLRLDLSEYRNAMSEMERQGIAWPSGDREKEGEKTFDMFFHMAWEAPFGAGRDDIFLQLQNVRAAMEAAKFAKQLGCQVFVGTGSQAEYGRVGEVRLRSDTPVNPETGYGSAKLCAGYLTRQFAEQEGMRHIWTRILSVYGPYDRSETLISTAVSRMRNNEDTEFTPCEQIWDYIYSEDAARALLLAGEKGIHGKTYVIGSGEAHPLRWYIEKIAEITGYTKEIGFGKRPYNEKQVMHLVADITELTEDTGFLPEIGFDEGIRRLIGNCRTQ